MDNNTATAGQLPATLEAKITAYEDTLLARLVAACNRFGISGKTYTEIAEDLGGFLFYKDTPLHIDKDGFQELRSQANFYREMLRRDLPITMLMQSYADIERISDIISTLRQTAEPSKERQLLADFGEAFTAGTPWAQAEILRRYDWMLPDSDTQTFVASQTLFLFYLNSIYFSGATAEELLQVEPRGLTLNEKEREFSVQEAMRAAAGFDSKTRNARPSTANEKAEEIGVDIEIPEEISPKGEPTISGMADDSKPVEEALYIDEEQERQRFLILRQSYTKVLSRPLPISFASQPKQSTEPIRIKDLMPLSDLIKEQAENFNISETRIYQCLDALQLFVQADGEKHTLRGYDYFFHDTSLANLIRMATGSNARPNGAVTSEFWTALWIINHIRICIDEEVIKGYMTDADGKKKPITEPWESWIQILEVPVISTPKKPQNKTPQAINLTLQIHSFVKEGRTRKYIMDTKLRRKLMVKQPAYHKITEAEEKLARKIFKRSATGIRFYNTLLSCYHKEEEALLAQVFDYQQKQSQAQTDEEYKAKALSILKHKGQDKKRLARMFAAAKDNGILESYSRYEVKDRLSRKPVAIWQWKRKQPNEGGSAEA